MTSFLELLTPERVIGRLKVASKAEALRQLAGRAAAAVALPEELILQALCRREALGATAIGHGIAIPHAVLPALSNSFALFARAAAPIPFEALDGRPVEVLFLFLTPEEGAAESTHLLAQVCRALRDPAALSLLKAASTDAALHAALTRVFAARKAA
jgi:PTS system nitrogen regulatory IIA component